MTHLNGRREQHVGFDVVTSTTKGAKRNENVEGYGSRVWRIISRGEV
jgi:hypothetical protein